MTFAELRAELLARGFNFLDDDRAKLFINWARAELDDMFLWPYREASVEGTPAPLQITDLGVVETVINLDQSTVLEPRSFKELVAYYGDLSTAGTPWCWYRATPDGVPEIATFPTSTDTIGIQYFRTTPDLVADLDEPLSPVRFHGLIIDMAVRRAYRDSDNGAAAGDLEAQIDRDVQLMAEALMLESIQGPAEFVPASGVDC